MLTSQERLEDLRWEEEVIGLLKRALLKGDEGSIHEAEVELKRIREHIKTHDYTIREKKRLAHLKATELHECLLY